MRYALILLAALLIVPVTAQAGQPLNLLTSLHSAPQPKKLMMYLPLNGGMTHETRYRSPLPNNVVLSWRIQSIELKGSAMVKGLDSCSPRSFRPDPSGLFASKMRTVGTGGLPLQTIVLAVLTKEQVQDEATRKAACFGEIRIVNN